MRNSSWIFLVFLMGNVALWAEEPFQEEPPPDSPGRALQNLLFPPELIMRNQSALQLTDEQREYIVKQVREIQGEFTGFRWEVQGRIETLTSMLRKSGNVDENLVLSELDQLLSLESRIKRSQMLLAIRIRNVLTEDQLAKLEDLKGERGAGIRRRGRPFQN